MTAMGINHRIVIRVGSPVMTLDLTYELIQMLWHYARNRKRSTDIVNAR